MNTPTAPGGARSDHLPILVGFLAGAGLGVAANVFWRGSSRLDWVLANVAEPIGQIFLRSLLMVVIPLVFATVTTGMMALGSLREVGRLGIRTVALYLGLALAGAVTGAGLVLGFRPGEIVGERLRAQLAAGAGGLGQTTPIGLDAIVGLIPTNVFATAARGDLLPFLVFTLLFGAALTSLPAAVAAPLHRFLDALGEVCGAMVRLVMKVAPLGVFGLAFANLGRFGWELLLPLLYFVLVVLASLAVVVGVIVPALLRMRTRIRPGAFFAASRPALVTAFATASSNATLPTTIRVAREGLGATPSIASFVIPLGATLSRAGTSAFTAATALFLAQVIGLGVTAGGVLSVIGLATITAIAAGGIPSGIVPLLATVVAGVGVPPGAIGLILGVEPLLGMARTPVNVAGALAATLVLEPRRGGAG
jgi:DAACS family dicarboxylate/amino acid:cation (Na+ or H+) symporter